MNDVIVLIPCSREHDAGWLPILKSQLTAADIPYETQHMNDIPPLGWGMATKIANYRNWISAHLNYEFIIIADAFDVQFFGDRETLLEKLRSIDGYLCAAERNCYPEAHLDPQIEGTTPWRFFNGGLTAGRPQALLDWLSALETHPQYNPNVLDQAFINRLLVEKSPLVKIDSTTKLFYCLYREHEGWELDFVEGYPYNTLTGEFPMFLHANGGSDRAEVWSKRERSLRRE